MGDIETPDGCTINGYSDLNHDDFIGLIKYSGGESNIVCVTGDQTFAEAISLQKFPITDYAFHNNNISTLYNSTPAGKAHMYVYFLKMIAFIDGQTKSFGDIIEDIKLLTLNGYDGDATESMMTRFFNYTIMYNNNKQTIYNIFYKYLNFETNLLSLAIFSVKNKVSPTIDNLSEYIEKL